LNGFFSIKKRIITLGVWVHESEQYLVCPDEEDIVEEKTVACEVKQVDVPCKQCQKDVFSTDEACWWCGVNHPG
jgi:hypothetical protein